MSTRVSIRRWIRRQIARYGRTARIIRIGAPLLLALLVAACSFDGSTIGRTTPTSTTPPRAERQDIIPTPTATPISPTATLPAPTATPKPPPAGVPPAPSATGRVILVSLSRQQLYAYEDGAFVFTILVETGRPELPTPTGVYHIFFKNCSDLRWTSNAAPTSAHNVNCTEHNGDGFREMFTSPWPEGSPYWYAPTHINYALKFREDGYYLHDAWWHEKFGPGGNVPHQISTGEWETGSHGCVGMPISDAEKLYRWAPIGTTVYIRANI